MRRFLYIAICAALLPGGLVAQRRGGGGGGGMRGGGGFHGPVGGGVARGGGFVRGGSGFVRSGGFDRGLGFERGFLLGGFNRGFGFGGSYGGYYPYYSYGGYYPGYNDYYPDAYSYPQYGYQPNVTVVYGAQPQPAAPVYVETAHPVSHEYDEYGQEIHSSGGPAGSPIYLIAFKDHVIRAASSYSVSGDTLHYATLQHEEKTAALSEVDRDFSAQLNRERHVPFQLPAQ